MIKKRLWIGLAIGLLLAVLLWVFRVPVAPVNAESVQLTVITEYIVVEDFAAMPRGDSMTVTVEPGSEPHAAIAAAMKQLRCRRCFHTLRDQSIPDGTGQEEILVSYGENSLHLAQGADHIWCNGGVYDAAGKADSDELLRQPCPKKIA